jgi:hypothetical protein
LLDEGSETDPTRWTGCLPASTCATDVSSRATTRIIPEVVNWGKVQICAFFALKKEKEKTTQAVKTTPHIN